MALNSSHRVHSQAHVNHHTVRANGSAHHHAAPEVAAVSGVAALASPKAPPKQGAPKVPRGFAPPAPKKGRKISLQRSQLASAVMVAAELQASQAPEADFGPHAPALAPVGALMALAAAWSAERSRAESWHGYVRAQEIDAWTPVLAAIDALRPAFTYARESDPTIAERYPSLSLFFGLGSQVGVKAARSRQANKVARGKAAKAALPANAQAQSAEVPVNGHVATVQ